MSKKGTFDLKISASSVKEIHRKYELAEDSANTTSIEAVENIDSLQFLDETRKSRKCILSKIDFSGSENYSCFWCRHPITDECIGCPTKYVSSVVHRSYFSEINKEKFMVKESIIESKSKISVDSDLFHESNDYYETDGIFCSFACCMAFIKDNKKISLYSDSETLLNRIADFKVEPAPHWRMLKIYGGTLDIEEFRKSCKTSHYENLGVYKPFFKSIAHTFEQKIRLH